MKTCYQRNVILECNCSEPLIPSYGQAFDFVEVDSCDYKKPKQGIYEQTIMVRQSDIKNNDIVLNRLHL